MSEQVPPNLRALRILEVLSECREAPTPTQLNTRLGWPKQTVHRLCQTLIEAGILEKHDKRLYPDGMNYVDRVETNWAFRVALPIGTHVPFHCTASGKLYMASLPATQRRALLASLDLRALTSNTFTDPAALADELSLIRKRGYSLDREEFHAAMVAIAVPVTDNKGRFYAALAIHGPTQRFSLDDALARRTSLTAYAKRIGALLFPDETKLA